MIATAQTTPVAEKEIKARLQTSRPWYSQMDGLRFIAVFSVLIEHFAYFIGRHLHTAYFGVDLFFIISGFLITEGLLREKEAGQEKGLLKRFYLKRFLRIFPIYYLVLIVSLLVFPPFREVAGWAFTYTINYFESFTGRSIPDPYDHLWSLAVEEQFYMFWPLLILLVPIKKMSWVFGVIIVASIGYYLAYHRWLELPTRMFSLCLGAMLALIKLTNYSGYAAKAGRIIPALLLAAPLIYLFDHGLALTTLSTALVYTASLSAFPGGIARFLQWRPIVYVGKISYGVYLYHMFVAYIIGHSFLDRFWSNTPFIANNKVLFYNKWLVEFPLYTAITIGLAHLSFHYLEKPFLRMKSRLIESNR